MRRYISFYFCKSFKHIIFYHLPCLQHSANTPACSPLVSRIAERFDTDSVENQCDRQMDNDAKFLVGSLSVLVDSLIFYSTNRRRCQQFPCWEFCEFGKKRAAALHLCWQQLYINHWPLIRCTAYPRWHDGMSWKFSSLNYLYSLHVRQAWIQPFEHRALCAPNSHKVCQYQQVAAYHIHGDNIWNTAAFAPNHNSDRHPVQLEFFQVLDCHRVWFRRVLENKRQFQRSVQQHPLSVDDLYRWKCSLAVGLGFLVAQPLQNNPLHDSRPLFNQNCIRPRKLRTDKKRKCKRDRNEVNVVQN